MADEIRAMAPGIARGNQYMQLLDIVAYPYPMPGKLTEIDSVLGGYGIYQSLALLRTTD